MDRRYQGTEKVGGEDSKGASNPAQADGKDDPKAKDKDAAEGTTIPSAVGGAVAAVVLSPTDVVVEWIAPKGSMEGYRVERRVPGGEWGQVANLPANVRLFRDTGLTAQTSYEYRVLGKETDGLASIGHASLIKTDNPAQRSVFHVAPRTGSDSNPGTEEKPWKTLQHAHGRLQPGQTLLAKDGEYTSDRYAVLAITHSGRPEAWITYRNFPGQRPKIKSTVRKNWSGIEVRQASYIVVEGFELAGHNSDVNLEGAMAEMRKPSPYASSSGISVESRDLSKPIAHHIIIRNNYAHDHPLVGIAVMGADYVTVEDNRIVGNGRYSSYGGSGISVLVPRDSDANSTDYKFIIRRNESTGNSNEVPCVCYGYRQPTDGNGIILDTYKEYKGRTLVINNLVHDNGGRGIHAFHASNVDVFFNTTFQNSTIAITGDGEITAMESKNIRVRDNIMVARSDRPVNSTQHSTDVDFSHNFIFGGNRFTPTGNDSNRMNADPLFVGEGAPRDAFALRPESPAVNAASGTAPVPADDLLLTPRTLGSKADAGAIESH